MAFIKQILHQSRHILLYAFLMAILVFALKWLQWKYLITDYSIDIYIGLIAILFTSLGLWVANQMVREKVRTVIVEKEIYVDLPHGEINEAELNKLNLSGREREVLLLVVKGYSNAEIADSLFLSLSTVKTHVSNLLLKMDVRSRTQVIEKARRLRITP